MLRLPPEPAAAAALAALSAACVAPPLDLDGRPCDEEGRCVEGFECHPDVSLCVPAISRACPGDASSVCWDDIEGGESCDVPLAFLPCGPVDDCSLGCRSCSNGSWSTCSVTGCAGSCGPGETCVDRDCVCGAEVERGAPACGLGQECCEDACHDPTQPPCRCGGGPGCNGGESCCAGGCVDTQTSELHCGDCDDPCAAGQSCSDGGCVCDDAQLRACGAACVDTDVDPDHCGACAESCAEHPNVDDGGAQSCDLGICTYTCDSGWDDCTAALGCETDTSSSAAHCGSCLNDCAELLFGTATATCVAGECEAATCDAGLLDCDADPRNGCELDDSGLGLACPAPSCAAILAGAPTSADGRYVINPDGGAPFWVYCDMTGEGGGWTLLLKAASGDTFHYAASHWTTANVLNEQDPSRDEGDAKYDAFNRLPVRDLRAVWPELGGGTPWEWLQIDVWPAATTPLLGFSTHQSLGFAESAAAYNGSYFTRQVSQGCPAGEEIGRYGIDLTNPEICGTCSGCNTGTCIAAVRWGFRFNENGCCQWASDDAGGGIGYRNCDGGVRFSAGDWARDPFCCGTNAGVNRRLAVEIWGR